MIIYILIQIVIGILSTKEVIKAIKHISYGKAIGLDEIPSEV